ncbi:MAG: hypothetical protein JNM75_07910 [Rhodospirillales bacterium]|nr:hypothetical protein [Rhodospirillales bacterium]
MNNPRQIPLDAMVSGEPARPGFFISDGLEVCMSDGRSNSLSIKLTPDEARHFSQIFGQLAELAEQSGGLSAAECAGSA